MDRFIECKNQMPWRCAICLKSNMDRFIAVATKRDQAKIIV